MKIFSILFNCFREKARLGKVAECILDNWSCLRSWWKSKPVSASNVTFCIFILKKSLLLCSNVSVLTTNTLLLCPLQWFFVSNIAFELLRLHVQFFHRYHERVSTNFDPPCEKLIVPNSTQYAIHSHILRRLFLLVNIMDHNDASQSYGLFWTVNTL